MAKTLFGGSAVLTGALLLSALAFNASPSAAEHLADKSNQKARGQQSAPGSPGLPGETESPASSSESSETVAPDADFAGAVGRDAGEGSLTPAKNNGTLARPAAEKFTATAYALGGRTASGATVRRGLIAADRRVLPLGSRVRLEAGGYSGEYLVADTGRAVRGRKLDIWVPSTREAARFGRRPVKLTVLSYGGRRAVKTGRD
jgi:3D (Asp-Asp-Asp) domain-containing protein